MALEREDDIGLALCQMEELLTQPASGTQLRLGEMKLHEAPERLGELRRLPHLLAQRASPGVDVCRFRSRQALRGYQQPTQGDLQREFVPETLGAVRQRCEERAPFREG